MKNTSIFEFELGQFGVLDHLTMIILSKRFYGNYALENMDAIFVGCFCLSQDECFWDYAQKTMNGLFSEHAWEEYLYRYNKDKKILK